MQLTRRKKILIGVILLLTIGGAFYYFLVIRRATTVLTASPTQGFLPRALDLLRGRRTVPQPTPVPPAVVAERRKQERLFRVSQGPALGASLSPDGNRIRYFLRSDGSLWEADLEGLNRSQVGGMTFPNILRALWSPKRDAVIVLTSDDDNRTKKEFYNLTSGARKTLNANINDVAWAPDGSRIAYHFFNSFTGDNAIALSDSDGANFETLRRINFYDFTLFWPKKEIVVIATKPSGATETFIWRLDTHTGALAKMLTQNGFGMSMRWSPDGNRVIYSRSDGSGSLLNNLSGGFLETNPGSIAGLATLAEKCAFLKDSITILCGTPQTAADGATLPDDYYKGLWVPSDEVRKVNLATHGETVVASFQELFPPQDVFEPVPSDDGKYLFFENRQDDFVYALRLP